MFKNLFVFDSFFFSTSQANCCIIDLKCYRLSNFKNFTIQDLQDELSTNIKTRTKNKIFTKLFTILLFVVAKKDSSVKKNTDRNFEKANQFLNIEKKKPIIIKKIKRLKYDNNNQIFDKLLLDKNKSQNIEIQ